MRRPADHDVPFRASHAAAAARGDGLRPQLLAPLARSAVSPHNTTMRSDGMIQSGPDPVSGLVTKGPLTWCPSRGRNASEKTLNRARGKTNFRKTFKPMLAVSLVVAKNLLVPSGKSSLRVHAILAREEGRTRDRHGRWARMRWTRWCRAASDIDADGQAVWS